MVRTGAPRARVALSGGMMIASCNRRVAHSGDVFFSTVQSCILHLYVGIAFDTPEEARHDSAGGQRPIADVQLLGLPGDRAHFSQRLRGLLENGARFIDEKRGRPRQAHRLGGALE